MLERGHGAGVGPAVDGHRAWEVIEGRDGSGRRADIGEREGHGAGLEWGDTKAVGPVGNRSQKHSNDLEACMSSTRSTYMRVVFLV